MHANKLFIYLTEQIREFERLAEERFNISAQVMMQRAGKAAFDLLIKRWPHAKNIDVVCGSGNNGGDGYVLALLAHEHGLKVTIWQVGDHADLKINAKQAYELCLAANITISKLDDISNFEHPDVIVDAICGIGVHTELRENIVSAIKKILQMQTPILSIDIPSGVDADTGEILGIAVRATTTITFIGFKLGLLTGDGIAYTGELILNDLHLPQELFASCEPIAEKIRLSAYKTYLKPRPRNWHKGLSGHVLIVGGDLGYSGAPRMAAEAALRVGAGLVTVACRAENAIGMNTNYPEIMCRGILHARELEPLTKRADVIILGPGLGQSAWALSLWQIAIEQNLRIVLDADGLNLLAEHNKKKANWILTPHPGEAARLLQTTPQAIQKNRLTMGKMIVQAYGGVCVLKGAGTLIFAEKMLPALCDKGNPGMATAGMGDILSGVIGGLVAQGISLADAAKLGVYIHAMAADSAAKDGERGMVATDLLPYLRRLSNYND